MRRGGMRLSLGGATLLVFGVASSCGRTGLLFDGEGTTGGEPSTDGSLGMMGGDAGEMPPEDSGPSFDALPPIDVAVPPDAPTVPPICADAASTFIYLISSDNNLFSYDPAAAFFHEIATLNCPAIGQCQAPPGPPVPAYPFSMAVDQAGLAYVVFCDGELFTVSTADGHCEATGFASKQSGFPVNFGMGFTENAQGNGETLYVAANEFINPTPNSISILASIDTSNLALNVVGPLASELQAPELTGNAMGGLYAFYSFGPQLLQSGIAQIDPATAQVIGNSTLPNVTQGNAWAFAFWGGDFYTFTSPPDLPVGAGTLIQRYQPSTGTTSDVMTIRDQITGAGVSTCAPLR